MGQLLLQTLNVQLQVAAMSSRKQAFLLMSVQCKTRIAPQMHVAEEQQKLAGSRMAMCMIANLASS